MPRMVRSAVRIQWLSFAGFRAVLLKVRVGWFGTSKKSFVRRCSSRCSWLVWMLAAWTVTSTVEFSIGSATVKVPVTSVKRPRTLVPIRWRATKPTSV